MEEALIGIVTNHDQVCGATFPENERDECAFRHLILEAIAQLRDQHNKNKEGV